jgi:predicted MFS family arabinose efflux permease
MEVKWVAPNGRRPRRYGRASMTERRSVSLYALFALASGTAVANLYYAQPLIGPIGADLHVASATASLLLFCTQLGYAAGILLFVPLGDVRDRRRLVAVMMAIASLALVLCAVAPTFPCFCVGMILVGATTVSGQILVAFTADLSEEGSRGRSVGTVVSGLLIGVVAARVAGGVIGGALGWRAVFAIAAALNASLAILILRRAPASQPSSQTRYPALLRSVGSLVRRQRPLRVAMAFGFVSMASFNLLWTGMTLLLGSSAYGFSASQIGAVSAAGLGGAIVARRAGRLHDSGRGLLGSSLAWGVMLCAWLAFIPGGTDLGWLITGVILLDLGTQGQRILNQSDVLSLAPTARSRANTAYISGNFLGASVGSVTATALWSAGGWLDVVLAGAVACAAALGARMSRLAHRGPDDHGLVWCPAQGAAGGGMTRDLAGHECPAKDSSPAAAIPRSP